jgi:hypothetical protein
MKIKSETPIEELVQEYPETVIFLSQKDIRCVVCGEPIWGTLGEAMQEKGFTEDMKFQILLDINQLVNQKN